MTNDVTLVGNATRDPVVAEEIGASLRFRNVHVDQAEHVPAKTTVAPTLDEQPF